MSNILNEYPGLVFIVFVLLLLLYGCTGGVRALCKRWDIELKDRRAQQWIVSILLMFTLLSITAVLVLSGVFLYLLELAGLFAFAYVAVRLIMVAVSGTSKSLRKL